MMRTLIGMSEVNGIARRVPRCTNSAERREAGSVAESKKKAAKAAPEPEDEARRARLVAAGIVIEYEDESGNPTIRLKYEDD